LLGSQRQVSLAGRCHREPSTDIEELRRIIEDAVSKVEGALPHKPMDARAFTGSE
jgi:hypothetical protein